MLSRAHVLAAAEAIAGSVRRTPAIRLDELEKDGIELWAKAESLQHIGAFKARGASYAISQLRPEQLRGGVLTYSSGNHAQAVALAAKRAGIRARIAMPEDAPAIKVESVRALGAEITFAGTTSDHRRTAALAMQKRDGGTIIEPFDHEHTIAGQGTATLEFLDQLAEQERSLDALIVPVGGGGLIAGACLASEGTELEIHAAEPVGCDSMGQSIAAGELISVTPAPTIADGLKPTTVGKQNFELCRSRLAGCHTVSDDEIGAAMITLLTRRGLLVEPSGAAALAVAMRGLPGNPTRVGVILTGRNVAPERVAELIAKHAV